MDSYINLRCNNSDSGADFFMVADSWRVGLCAPCDGRDHACVCPLTSDNVGDQGLIIGE